jgi:hypothetical protein
MDNRIKPISVRELAVAVDFLKSESCDKMAVLHLPLKNGVATFKRNTDNEWELINLPFLAIEGLSPEQPFPPLPE